mgnify:CR=1 FL=1
MIKKKKNNIEECVLNIINEREKHPEKTLSELYDPTSMPKKLLSCHQDLDEIVEKCMTNKSFINDNDRLKFLINDFAKLKNKDTLI